MNGKGNCYVCQCPSFPLTKSNTPWKGSSCSRWILPTGNPRFVSSWRWSADIGSPVSIPLQPWTLYHRHYIAPFVLNITLTTLHYIFWRRMTFKNLFAASWGVIISTICLLMYDGVAATIIRTISSLLIHFNINTLKYVNMCQWSAICLGMGNTRSFLDNIIFSIWSVGIASINI